MRLFFPCSLRAPLSIATARKPCKKSFINILILTRTKLIYLPGWQTCTSPFVLLVTNVCLIFHKPQNVSLSTCNKTFPVLKSYWKVKPEQICLAFDTETRIFPPHLCCCVCVLLQQNRCLAQGLFNILKSFDLYVKYRTHIPQIKVYKSSGLSLQAPMFYTWKPLCKQIKKEMGEVGIVVLCSWSSPRTTPVCLCKTILETKLNSC